VLTASSAWLAALTPPKLLDGFRRAQPNNLSLAWLASEMPFEHDADKTHYLEGLEERGWGSRRQAPAGGDYRRHPPSLSTTFSCNPCVSSREMMMPRGRVIRPLPLCLITLYKT
jgi:hypothetical protein